jgi:hypothetical protein
MDMREKLKELIQDLDPEIRGIVSDVVELEGEYLDSRRPQVINKIRDIVDRYAKNGIGEAA